MKVLKKGLWGGLFGGFTVLMIGSLIGGDYAKNNGSAAINMFFGTSNTVTVNDPNAEPSIFFKSDYQNITNENKYTPETAQKLFEEDKKAVEDATAEGCVLLWNKSNALPLKVDTEKKISLFSQNSVDLVECGSGSGYVKTESKDGKDASIDMNEAFTSRGFEVNQKLWNFYRNLPDKYHRTNPKTACTEWRKWSTNEAPWSEYTSDVKDTFSVYGDVAFITISRTGGEYSDLHYNYDGFSDKVGDNDSLSNAENTSAEGGYLGLTDEEEQVFSNVTSLRNSGIIKKVVLLLNTPNPIQFQDISSYYNGIDAAMWIGQPGASGINAVVDLLIGKCTPSGHLADTFLYDLNSAPASENDGNYQYAGDCSKYSKNSNRYYAYMVYQEGIYVGYRYYETRYEDQILNTNNAVSSKGAKHSTSGWNYDEEVAFPFGYGDSYTRFTYSGFAVNKVGNDYEVSVTVKNIGNYSGKEVVQVYLQKPYTNFDKSHGIEKASVELVGYAKTGLLAKNASEEVKVTVPYEYFKTYDAEVNKTYIVEQGNYYLTVANDAHFAINNILNKKGRSNTTYSLFGGYEKLNKPNTGNTMVEKIAIEEDKVTFSKSTQTGTAITNQFDNGDINKYKNRGENHVTYLSRKDWEATYPSTPTLTLNSAMIDDLKANTTPDDTGYEMPAYGVFASGSIDGTPNVSEGDLVAIQFMEAPLYPELADEATKQMIIDGKPYVEYWNERWNQLMDQMTWSEQALMCANAYHQINGAISVALPTTKQENGPVGITNRGSQFPVPDTNIKYYYYMCYPCASLIAASYNKDVAENIGKHKSEDMLFLGYNGIYGPGVNMHRTPYGGRAFEYPSEDPMLAGTIEYFESKGIESKGCLAFAKHFAMNDTETNRRHIGVWSNEQATREIYLKAFELCFAEGGASATMNSFSRIGTKWNGGCKEIMTNVLRKEWGWDGLNITDWMSDGPMSYVDAIVGGTNTFDGNGTAESFSEWKNNKVVAQALRESARVIIYNVVRTNAMNGLSLTTKVVKVTPWWESAIGGAQGALIALSSTFGVLFIASFIFPIKKKKQFVDYGPKQKVINIASFSVLGIGLVAAVLLGVLPVVTSQNANQAAIDGAISSIEKSTEDGPNLMHY